MPITIGSKVNTALGRPYSALLFNPLRGYRFEALAAGRPGQAWAAQWSLPGIDAAFDQQPVYQRPGQHAANATFYGQDAPAIAYGVVVPVIISQGAKPYCDRHTITKDDEWAGEADADIIDVRLDLRAQPTKSLAGSVRFGANAEPASLVILFERRTPKNRIVVEPDQSGAWQAPIYDGEWFVIYIRTGCKPVCHGPFTLAKA